MRRLASERGAVSTEFAVIMAAFLTSFMLIVVFAGRVATAEDQARALLFLGSDLAGYINGVNLLVDGGFSAAMQMGQAIPPGAQ